MHDSPPPAPSEVQFAVWIESVEAAFWRGARDDNFNSDQGYPAGKS